MSRFTCASLDGQCEFRKWMLRLSSVPAACRRCSPSKPFHDLSRSRCARRLSASRGLMFSAQRVSVISPCVASVARCDEFCRSRCTTAGWSQPKVQFLAAVGWLRRRVLSLYATRPPHDTVCGSVQATGRGHTRCALHVRKRTAHSAQHIVAATAFSYRSRVRTQHGSSVSRLTAVTSASSRTASPHQQHSHAHPPPCCTHHTGSSTPPSSSHSTTPPFDSASRQPRPLPRHARHASPAARCWTKRTLSLLLRRLLLLLPLFLLFLLLLL